MTSLSHLLIATTAVLVVATVLLFTVRSTRPVRHRIMAALLGAAVVAATVGYGLVLFGEPASFTLPAALAIGVTLPAWLPIARAGTCADWPPGP